MKLPVLRTGSSQRAVAVLWRTEDGTAKKGVDYKEGQVGGAVVANLFLYLRKSIHVLVQKGTVFDIVSRIELKRIQSPNSPLN